MITVATGDTFQLKCRFKASPTAPTSLDGYTITSMVKTSDGLRHQAVVTYDTLPSVAWFVTIADTSNWPVGEGEWDCKVVKNGLTVHTAKQPVIVSKSVTL